MRRHFLLKIRKNFASSLQQGFPIKDRDSVLAAINREGEIQVVAAQLMVAPRVQTIVSPQLIIQSEILSLSTEELHERIKKELEANPALEIADEAYFFPGDYPVLSSSDIGGEAVERLRAPHTLREELLLQLASVRGRTRKLCEYLLECLDERGYLSIAAEEIAAQWHVPLSEVQEAITVLQSLEPAGIGARNLQECLLLQIRRLPASEVPPRTKDFVEAFFQAGCRKKPEQIAARLGIKKKALARIIAFIRERLYIWPAEHVSSEITLMRAGQPVVPEARIVWEGDKLCVQLLQNWGQLLRVSEAWARWECLKRRHLGADISDMQRAEQVQRARGFIAHLARREALLLAVTKAIVAAQREFFVQGYPALVPLTRRDIASVVGVHESTISRITNGKYVQLPSGEIVAYDFFFDASFSAKQMLRALIQSEPAGRPWTDAELAQRLRQAGYPLARRTVAKYREQMAIPPAHRRRRLTLGEAL